MNRLSVFLALWLMYIAGYFVGIAVERKRHERT